MKVEIKTLFKAIFLIILVLTIVTQTTSADLFVTQIASGNKLTTTTLDFSNRDSATNNLNSILFNVSGFVAGGFEVKGVRLKKDGQMIFKYQATAIKTAGDDLLCNALVLTVLKNWQIKYQGSLLGLALESEISNGNFDDWVFHLGLENNDSSLTNKTCDFNFVFKTYRDSAGEEPSGFWDEEILGNHILSGIWPST